MFAVFNMDKFAEASKVSSILIAEALVPFLVPVRDFDPVPAISSLAAID
jgi:hypothetical protein